MLAAKASEGAQNKTIARKEIEHARRILEFIEQRYPGFIWTVKVNLTGKYRGAAVSLPALLPPHTYNVVPGCHLCTENDMRRYSLEAAGNLLERYKVPRSTMKFAEVPFLEARAKADVFNLRRKAGVPQ
jgi:hypothetical protein